MTISATIAKLRAKYRPVANLTRDHFRYGAKLEAKRIGRNGFFFYVTDEDSNVLAVSVRLHNTHIWGEVDGVQYFHLNGWNTPTTRRWLNELLPYNVHSTNHVPHYAGKPIDPHRVHAIAGSVAMPMVQYRSLNPNLWESDTPFGYASRKLVTGEAA